MTRVTHDITNEREPLRVSCAIGWSVVAVLAFQTAFLVPQAGFLIAVYLYGFCQITRVATPRVALYLGLGTKFLALAPQLLFMWTIFDRFAIALWLVGAFWGGLFALLGQRARTEFGRWPAVFCLPILWTGLEYLRSEAYYLRFSWLVPGYAFSFSPGVQAAHWLGIYGIGFVLVLAVMLVESRPRAVQLAALVLLGLATHLLPASSRSASSAAPAPQVVGIQLEFPTPGEAVAALDRALQKHPESQLFVLSEYAFDGPVPEVVRHWCADHRRHLVAGGKDESSDKKAGFCNTAFVVGPDGRILFRQVKAVPVQFFKDGAAATSQALWDSPWGKIGLCICYDLSYRRVTDELVRLGAQALIVPTMDERSWGRQEHALHSRVAPLRAAEYGIPVFRLCSSGISQSVAAEGAVEASAPFPGQGEMLAATLPMQGAGRVPVDHYLAPAAMYLTGATAVWLLLVAPIRRFVRRNPGLPARAKGVSLRAKD